jgi:hypothetical protein
VTTKLELFQDRFFHRKSDFAFQRFNDHTGKWYYHRQGRALEREDIEKHLAKRETLATYPVDEDDTSRFFIVDIDIDDDVDELDEAAQQHTLRIATQIQKLFGQKRQLLASSGRRGYHIWVWLEAALPAGRVKVMGEYITSLFEAPEGIHTEVYPKQAQIYEGVGNCVKVPMGVHKKTDNPTCFVDASFNPVDDPWKRLLQIEPIPYEVFDAVWNQKRLVEEETRLVESEDQALPCMLNLMNEGPTKGTRSVALFYLATNLIRGGLTMNYVEEVVKDVNEKGEKPLFRAEVEKAIDSAAKRSYSRFPCKRAELDHYCESSCPFFPNKRKQRQETVISRS